MMIGDRETVTRTETMIRDRETDLDTLTGRLTRGLRLETGRQ